MIYISVPWVPAGELDFQQWFEIADRRHEKMLSIAAKFIKKKHHIYCPFLHQHLLYRYHGAGWGTVAWLDQNLPFLRMATELMVMMFPDHSEKDHDKSKEVELARELGIIISWVLPDMEGLENRSSPSPPPK